MSQIAKELRQYGRMFSQLTLTEDLSAFTPVFAEGKVVFYEDTVTDTLMSKYKVRPPILTDTPVVEVQEPQVNNPDLASIKRMLEAICKDLNIAVH